jgi:hypothetical protein
MAGKKWERPPTSKGDNQKVRQKAQSARAKGQKSSFRFLFDLFSGGRK